MVKRVLRALAPLLLLLIGVGMVAYGVWGHTITVVLKPETDQAETSTSKTEAAKTDATGEAAEDEAADETSDESETPDDEMTEDDFAEEEGLPPGMGPPDDPWSKPAGNNPWMTPSVEDESDETDESEEPAETSQETEKPKQPAKSEEQIVEDPEPVIVRDVTVGGLIMSATGQLVRTYSVEKPPALCPT